MKIPQDIFWIGPAHPFDLHEAYLVFRAEFDLPVVPATSILRLSADSRYRLRVNGVFAGRGPERSWPTSMAVDERDITALLRAGANEIEIEVYSPGYSHFAHVSRGACGTICWLEADGAVVLRSNSDWRVRRDHSWSDRVRRVSIYGTGVEDRDLRLGPSPFEPARIVQTAEGPVWRTLRPRATALPAEIVRTLAAPWQTRVGPTPHATNDPHGDLRAAFSASSPAGLPAALRSGETAIWVFDLGESRSCVAGADITAAGGERLLVSYAEKLRGGELVLSDPATYCRMRPTDRFMLRPGRQRIEGFMPRGARFLVFALEGAGVAPEAEFHVRLPHYPTVEKPLPGFGDPTLDAVAAMCRRTTLACLQDGFVDGVWRESSLWLGDAVAQDRALRAISDDPRPLIFTIDMAAEGRDGEGLLPSVLPGAIPAYSVTDYNFSWIELLAGCETHPGIADPQAVWRRHWATLCGVLEAMSGHTGPDGLLRNPPGRRLFLDWSPMDRSEPNLTLNLRYLYALQLAADMAAGLGDPQEPVWRDRARALTAALATLWEAGVWRESPGGAQASQLALAFLVLTGIADGVEAEILADRIAARSLDLRDEHDPDGPPLASPFMHHYLFMALERLGRRDAIRSIISARWGRWANAGLANTPENWSIDFPDGSACHGFSAHPLGWLVRIVDRQVCHA